MNKTVLLWLLGAVIAASGCGLKPARVIPGDVSIDSILAAIRGQSEAVRDFSGVGRVSFSDGGGVRTSTFTFRSIRPDRFRLDLRGFAGIEIASVSSDGDSLTVYIPFMNGYIRVPQGAPDYTPHNPGRAYSGDPDTGRDAGLLARLIPQMDFGVERFAPIAAGFLPLPESIEQYSLTMRAWKQEAELTAGYENTIYRYLVSGPDLTVIEECVTEGGETLWLLQRSEFESRGGTTLPRVLRFERDSAVVTVRFGKYTVNTGITENDLAIDLPEDAERLSIKNPVKR